MTIKKASRKWGLFFYWCGWACIIVATGALIYGFLTLESSAHAGFLIGRSIVVYLMGGYWLRKGTKEIAKARIEEFK
jgi:hypothetical protein